LAFLDWEDLGPSGSTPVDYPDFAEKLAKKVAAGHAAFGVLICGSGIGMCIAANKTLGIRAAACDNLFSAKVSREHNDCNVLCLGSRIIANAYATEITKTFLTTEFSGTTRHIQRVQKITLMETHLIPDAE
ncbi:MAG: RpiB/LacA/LacB family sugar-phosphate isomerase, partial [Bdellovibrionota bacterium]